MHIHIGLIQFAQFVAYYSITSILFALAEYALRGTALGGALAWMRQ